MRTGQVIKDQPRAGRPKTEEKNPQLAVDIRNLVESNAQTDPKFQGLFQYTRMTAKAVRQALIEQKGYTDEELPCENTIGAILNGMSSSNL